MLLQDAISIHAPPRGATHCCERMSTIVLFQFTPLREGRHKSFLQSGESGTISIHAPPRGATEYDKLRVLYHKIFQFTPLREGRRFGNRSANAFSHFNSRPSARGDIAYRVTKAECLISIHAPPRGATSPAASSRTTMAHFNSRPSARGDRTYGAGLDH